MGGVQVNTDVLSWLLRPVPYLAGLPAPPPPASSNTPAHNAERNSPGTAARGEARTAAAAAAAGNPSGCGDCGGDNGCGGVGGGSPGVDRLRGVFAEEGKGGGASDGDDSKEILVGAAASTTAEGEADGKTEAMARHAVGASYVGAAVGERRAAPVVQGSVAALADALDGRTGGEGGGGIGGDQERASNRAAFHSYDETHQVGVEIEGRCSGVAFDVRTNLHLATTTAALSCSSREGVGPVQQ